MLKRLNVNKELWSIYNLCEKPYFDQGNFREFNDRKELKKLYSPIDDKWWQNSKIYSSFDTSCLFQVKKNTQKNSLNPEWTKQMSRPQGETEAEASEKLNQNRNLTLFGSTFFILSHAVCMQYIVLTEVCFKL